MSGLSFRQAGALEAPVALLLHGFPETSRMWARVMPYVNGAGWRAVAPDLAALGSWEAHVDALDAFVLEHDLPPVALVVHDWGGLIGLRWACDHPERVRALVISDTGFFPDGRWHDLAAVMRTPGEGEKLMDALTPELFTQMFTTVAPRFDLAAIDEYWSVYGTAEGRAAALELYRSGEFSKLAPYEGRLAELGVPTLVVWGAEDRFAPVGGAHRFAREIPAARLELVEGAGHFLWEEAPERAGAILADFLRGL